MIIANKPAFDLLPQIRDVVTSCMFCRNFPCKLKLNPETTLSTPIECQLFRELGNDNLQQTKK